MKTFWEGMPSVLRVMDGNYKFYTGGILGYNLAYFLSAWFNIIGAYIVFIILTALSFFLLGKEELLFSAGRFARDTFLNGAEYVRSLFAGRQDEAVERVKKVKKPAGKKEEDEEDEEEEADDKKR